MGIKRIINQDALTVKQVYNFFRLQDSCNQAESKLGTDCAYKQNLIETSMQVGRFWKMIDAVDFSLKRIDGRWRDRGIECFPICLGQMMSFRENNHFGCATESLDPENKALQKFNRSDRPGAIQIQSQSILRQFTWFSQENIHNPQLRNAHCILLNSIATILK